MMQNELPPLNETERNLANTLFCVTATADGKSFLNFSPTLRQEYDGGLHSPLQQLSSFYPEWDSLLPPPENKITDLWLNRRKIPEISKDGITVYPQLQGSPADIFLSLSETNSEVQKTIDDRISIAKQVMLFGAISIPSVMETITWLKTKEFKGKLSIFDISSVPIEVGKVYKKFGLLSSNFDVEFIKSDVLSLPQETSKADLIISDVLGYYLTPEQYTRLTGVIENTLSNSGLWLTRELVEPQGAPNPEDRTVLKLSPDERTNGFNRFIERLFSIKLPVEDIQQFENTRWAIAQTYSRRTGEEYRVNLPAGLKVVDTINVTSEALIKAQQQRIFETSIISKISK